MFSFLKGLFGDFWSGRDEERRQETSAEEQAHLLEMDEPMAGAGGQLSGEHIKSETERNLERAAARERT
jgi:hypothetical protein